MLMRKILVTCSLFLLLSGASVSTIPFISSLGPSASAGAMLPRINISDLEPGGFNTFDYPSSNNPYESYDAFHYSWSLCD